MATDPNSTDLKREIQATLAARRELGPDFDEHFLDRLVEQIKGDSKAPVPTQPCVMLERAGIRVAVMGLTVPMFTRKMWSQALCDYLYESPLETARVLARELRPQCDLLIALTHIGLREDEALAADVGADGVHLREHSLHRADTVARSGWIVTAACHSPEAVARAETQSGLDAVLVSPVFASASPSAQGVVPLGARGARALAETASLPVIAMGGITCDTVERVRDCGLSGVAAVEAFKLEDV